MTVGGRRFATVDGKIRLLRLLVAEGGNRAWAEVETESLQLAAEVDPKSLRFAHRPDVDPVDGWLELRAGSIEEASEGQATMSFELPGRLEPATPKASVRIACADLTLWRDGQPSTWGDTELRPGSRTPLAVSPGGDLLGHILTPTKAPPVNIGGNVVEVYEPPDIKKLEEKAGFIRVRLAGGSSTVVGWIPKSAVDRSGQRAGLLGMLSGSGRFREATFTCSRDVDLFVDDGQARVRVGVVRANTAAPGRRREDGTIRVDLDTSIGFADLFGNQPRSPKDERLYPYVTAEDAASCTAEDPGDR